MSKCEICGKTTTFGVNVSYSRSHVSGRHNRTVKPNLITKTLQIDNKYKRITACTRCVRTLAKANRPRQ